MAIVKIPPPESQRGTCSHVRSFLCGFDKYRTEKVQTNEGQEEIDEKPLAGIPRICPQGHLREMVQPRDGQCKQCPQAFFVEGAMREQPGRQWRHGI